MRRNMQGGHSGNPQRSAAAFCEGLFYRFYFKVFPDLSGQAIADFCMWRYGGTLFFLGGIPATMNIDRLGAFSDEGAPLCSEVFDEFGSLHAGTAIFSSLNPAPADAIASCRLNSIASYGVTRRLSTKSWRVRSWQFTPGTSSIHPIHQSPSCFITAAYSVAINSPPLGPND